MNPLLVVAPLALALAPGLDGRSGGDERRLLVLNKSEASMSLVDVASGETEDAWPTGEGPHEVAVTEDGRTAVVCDYGAQQPGSTLTVFDLTGAAAPRTLSLGELRRPHGIAFEDEDHVLVTVEANRAIARVHVGRGEVVDVLPTEQAISHMLALTPDRSRAFVANIGSGSCTAIDLATGEILAQIETGPGAEGIDVAPDGSEVWVTNRAADTISVIDAKSLEVIDQIACATFPIRAKFTPDGKHVLVSNAESGDVVVFDAVFREEVARIPMELSAKEGTEGRLFGDQFGESPVPVGILVQPDGARAYVANTNADIVTVLDLDDWKVVGRLVAGDEPDGLGWGVAPGQTD